jgi:primary-amine oxidase
MPCDTMTVSLKPSGFFDRNPALDVPQSTQQLNGSRLLEDKDLKEVVTDRGGQEECCKVRDSRL